MTRSLLLFLVASVLLAGDAPAQDLRTPPSRPVDVLHIGLDLVVDLEAKSVEGTAVLTLQALRDVKSIRLNAVDHEIAGVEVGGGDAWRKAPFAYDGEFLVVDALLKRGERVTVKVTYKVVDPPSGLHFFGPSEAAPGVPWQVWSQGEAIQNRRWFPSADHPDERQATTLTVHVKEGLTVVSNGVLVSKEKQKTGLVRWSFEQKREHVAYLVSLIVGTFDQVEDSWKGMPLSYYVPLGRKADIPRSFARTKDMLEFFSTLTGQPYPWPKYDQTVVFEFTAGGMENTGATTLSERTLHDERAHLDYSSEGLVAHELAHQWFGDLLTCRDWSHLWLNESFATFFAMAWEEHAKGADAYAYSVLKASESGMRAGRTRAIVDRRYDKPWSMFDGRAYPKGGCVLHMLRRQLGEETFWRGVRDYTAEFKDRSVESEDLRRSLERTSGQNLERFFRDWTARPGHPALDVELKRDAEGGLLTVRVRQTQKAEAYAFPAEFEFFFGDEKVVHTFDVTSKDERFVLAERRAPTRFRFDPREAVVLKEIKVVKGRDLWLAQLASGDVVGRIRAARALAKQGAPKVKAALLAALSGDSFWGVRVEIAGLIAKGGEDAARDALITGLRGDTHAKVRRACADALGAYKRDPQAAQALAEVVRASDPSYYVQAAAIASYAKAFSGADPQVAVKLLATQLEVASHNEVVRSAAIRGLRQLEDPRSTGLLAALTAPEHSTAVRQTASRALSLAALPGATDEQAKTAVSALRACLKTSRSRGIRAALDGLKALGNRARAALAEVEALAETHSSKRVREQAAKTAEAIRATTQPNVEIVRLRELNRALTTRTEELEKTRDALEARLKRVEKALERLEAKK
jgi:aminopeptidase N